jgi:predicted Zn-dependent protease
MVKQSLGRLMKSEFTRPSRFVGVVLVVSVFVMASLASTSPEQRKRSKSDRDIHAIGHRKLLPQEKDFYSIDRELEFGKKLASSYEAQATLVRDVAVSAYLERVALHIAENSDARMLVTVHIVESDRASAFTLPGGRTYITTALILQLKSEGELASILAREIAHTALRSSSRELTWKMLLKVADVPIVFGDNSALLARANVATSPIMLAFWKRSDEFDADYFGIQYLYESGYDTNCFLSALQTESPFDRGMQPVSFSPVPALTDRLEALRAEINSILPTRQSSIVSTPEFSEFMERLRTLIPPKPATEPTTDPTLIHPASN